jgi:hypothetical protein
MPHRGRKGCEAILRSQRLLSLKAPQGLSGLLVEKTYWRSAMGTNGSAIAAINTERPSPSGIPIWDFL